MKRPLCGRFSWRAVAEGFGGSAPPTKICPVFPEANFALPESGDPKNANPCVPGKGDLEGFRPTGR